jgi:hypothetical protein
MFKRYALLASKMKHFSEQHRSDSGGLFLPEVLFGDARCAFLGRIA